MTEYLVPYESAESEFEEKRSRFISAPRTNYPNTHCQKRNRSNQLVSSAENRPDHLPCSNFTGLNKNKS